MDIIRCRYTYENYENAKQENIKSPLNENEKFGKHVVLNFLIEARNWLLDKFKYLPSVLYYF